MLTYEYMEYNNFIKALRLPFITVTVLPFLFGSLIDRSDFSVLNFFLGLIAAVSVHLAANLINDYADSRSGADWRDKSFYGFFGGSKLIQHEILPESFYLKTALLFSFTGLVSTVFLAVLMKSALIVSFYIIILALAFSYSVKPFQFSYKRLGEAIVFILFGPALVMGGYFIQTGIFPSKESFLMSLPFGFMTVAVLFANEVPDFKDDERSGKVTWVSFSGRDKAFITYCILIFLVFFSVALNIISEYLDVSTFFSFIFAVLAIKAAIVLKDSPDDKAKLLTSSKLTVLLHALLSLFLLLEVML